MSETPENGPENGNGATAADAAGPSMVVIAQYLKDLSFENPRAPQSFLANVTPQIEVNVDVNARALGDDRYEVELSVAARAKHEGEPIFVVEAAYAGAFEIKGLPREQLEMVMLVECPRLIFPFLRQIIADATRNGNYPPLMMEPIDFFAIYQANAEKVRQARPEGQAPAQP